MKTLILITCLGALLALQGTLTRASAQVPVDRTNVIMFVHEVTNDVNASAGWHSKWTFYDGNGVGAWHNDQRKVKSGTTLEWRSKKPFSILARRDNTDWLLTLTGQTWQAGKPYTLILPSGKTNLFQFVDAIKIGTNWTVQATLSKTNTTAATDKIEYSVFDSLAFRGGGTELGLAAPSGSDSSDATLDWDNSQTEGGRR